MSDAVGVLDRHRGAHRHVQRGGLEGEVLDQDVGRTGGRGRRRLRRRRRLGGGRGRLRLRWVRSGSRRRRRRRLAGGLGGGGRSGRRRRRRWLAITPVVGTGLRRAGVGVGRRIGCGGRRGGGGQRAGLVAAT